MCCKKCSTLCGVVMVVVGLLFLLTDLGYWNFWGIQWWTVIFLLFGIGTLGKNNCPDCQSCGTGSCCTEMPVKGKKK